MFDRSLLISLRSVVGIVLVMLGLGTIAGCGGGGGGESNQVSITSQPASRTVVDGSTAAFSVTASNASSYQWQRLVGSNWADVSGAVAASYTLSADSSSNGLQLRVVVTGTGGSTTSSVATLSVTPVAVAITTEPQPITVAQGLDASFIVGVTGTTPAYRWQVSSNSGVSWADATGGTNATLVVPAVGAGDNGKQYRVLVSGPSGSSATSHAALLTVLGNVLITAQPSNQSATEGSAATFTVAADNASGYQWQRLVGSTWTDVTGATSASYSFNAALTISGLQVRVVISGTGGPVVSNAAVLTVTAAVVAPSITTDPQNTTVTAGQSATFAVTSGGSSPVYRWQLSANSGASWSDVAGGNGSALVLSNTAIADSGKQYRVVVSNSAGSVTSRVASLTVVGVLAITQQPASLTVVEGSAASIAVSATNAIAYQWQRLVNSAWIDVGAATGPTLAFTAALSDNGAQFRVVVTGALGSTTSAVASLTVTALIVAPTITSQPADQFVGSGLDAFFQVSATGSSLSYQWQLSSDGGVNWSSLSGGGASSYVFPAAVEGDSGKQLRVIVSNGGGSVTSRAATLRVEFVLVADSSACLTANCSGGADTGDGGASGVGGDGGGASAGPGLSAMRKVQVIVRKPSGQVLGTVALCPALPCTGYLVSLKPRGYAGPFIVEFADNGGGEYFDEAQRAWLSMQGTKLRVMVPTLAHHVSVNPLTEAAYQYALQRAGGVETGLTTSAMQTANDLMKAQLNAKLPNPYRAVDITNFVTPLTDVSPSGVLTNSHAGRYGAVIAGLPVAGALFDSSLAAPALSFLRQLSADFKDDGLFNASAQPTGAAYGDTVTAYMNSGICRAVAAWGSASMPSQLGAQTATAPRAGYLTLLAGTLGGAGTCDGWGTSARFGRPTRVAIDSVGNLYVADQASATVRKVSAQGAVTTLAGLPGKTGNVDGSGFAARFQNPTGVAVDSSGTVYVTDGGAIRKITAAGVVSTLAGAQQALGSVDGTGSAARFSGPQDLAIDLSGNVIVADSYGGSIRKVTPAGVVTTFNPSCANSVGFPEGVTVDANGNIYFAGDGRICRFNPSTGASAEFGAGSLNWPRGMAVDASGNIYVADSFNEVIRRITPANVVSTVAGAVVQRGYVDATAGAARFRRPSSVVRDAGGNLYVADEENNSIRRIATSGAVTTFAGLGPDYGNVDGTGSAARFSAPVASVADAQGNVYTVDSFSYTIRKVTPAGLVSTLAGAAGQCGFFDDVGTGARFSFSESGCSLTPDPAQTERRALGMAIDGSGNLYVVDKGNSRIRKISPLGVVSTFAQVASPTGLAVDAVGNVFVSMYDSVSRSEQIRRITPSGVTTVLASGSGLQGVMAMDSAGALYVAAPSARVIYKVSAGGVTTVFAGTVGQGGTADGVGSAARFSAPVTIAINRLGTLFVGELSGGTANGVYGGAIARTIRQVSSAGVVTTVVGSPGGIGNIIDALPASLGYITSIAVIADKQIAITSDDGVFVATFP
jgi:sugar lactone lactonase YvrE